MLSGLNLDFATSTDLLRMSKDKLLFETSLNRAPSGMLVFLGIRPFGVNSIVINGLGLTKETWSTLKSSRLSISQIKSPLSFVSPWFCWIVEPEYRMRPSLSSTWFVLCMSPRKAKSNWSKIEMSFSPNSIVQPRSVVTPEMDPW